MPTARTEQVVADEDPGDLSSTVDPALFDDAPEIALALFAARTGIASAARRVARGFVKQASPESLQALVRVAAELGLRASAARASITALPKLTLPTIVHLRSPEVEGAAGFAVLSACDEDSVVLETGKRGTLHRLTLDEFASVWTGIVVTFTRVETPRRRFDAGLRPLRAVADWVAGEDAVDRGLDRLSLAACRAGSLALVGAAVAGGIGVARAGHPGVGAALAGSALLAALGALASWQLLVRRSAGEPGGPSTGFLARVCGGRGGLLDCNGPLASKWASPLGIELSAIGLAFFAATLFLQATAAILPASVAWAAYRGLALVHFAALVPAVFYVGVQIYPLRRLCPLCLVAHLAIVAGALAGFAVVSSAAAPAGSALSVPSLSFALPFALVFCLAFGAARLMVRDRQDNEAMAARLARIDRSVFGALAEFHGQPTLPSPPPDSPFVLGDPDAGFRLDVLVDPACASCGPALDRLALLVERRPGLVHVAVHVPTADHDEADRDLRLALLAAGTPDAYHAVKEQLAELRELATAGSAAALDALGGPAFPDGLARARAGADAADALLDAAGGVTPTVLFANKVWNAPIGDLETLLVKHPSTLAALVATSGAARP